MRRIFIAGNWKMNKTVPESISFTRELKMKTLGYNNIDILICPPLTSLISILEIIKDSKIRLGAQNVHWEDSGAFTGEVSTSMLESAGCSHVIIGHSERRQYFGESNDLLNKKLKKVLKSKLLPIYCVGETIDQRKLGHTEKVVDEQIRSGLNGIGTDQIGRITIAYEPVWAIGTGETATPEQAEEVHLYIRNLITELYGDAIAENIRIQYGGSVKPSNAKELLMQKDIDGALIGGASIDLTSFSEILKIADQIVK